jgi:hypothetical protein
MPTRMRVAPVALTVLLAGCAAESPSEQPSAAATLWPNSTPGSSYDLAEIVISPSDPPAGMSHDETGEGDSVLTSAVISGRAAEFLALPGFHDGRLTRFSGKSGALLSLGLAFETPQNAAVAYDLFLDELQSEVGYGFGPGHDAGLGDEGTCDEGTNRALDGLQESICLWREGALVLIAGGPIEPGRLYKFAEAMNRAVGDPSSATRVVGPTDDSYDAAIDIATAHGGLTELLDRHPYGVDAVVTRPGGRVDVFMWFLNAVPIEEWPFGPTCEVTLGDQFTGVHTVVNLETEKVVAVSPRWEISSCISVPHP